jgi:hypothetical protein
VRTRTEYFSLPASAVSPDDVTPLCSLDGWLGLLVQVEGTFVATYDIEGSLDGKTWFSLAGFMSDVRTGGTFDGTAPFLASLAYFGGLGAPAFVRARCSSHSSSDATAIVRFSGPDGR